MDGNYWTRKHQQGAWTGGMPYGATTARRLSRRRLLAAAAAAAGTGVLIACGGGKDGDKGTTEQAPAGGQAAPTQQTVRIRRSGTLLYALEQNPKDFDPMKSNDVPSNRIVGNVFEGLYKYDDQLKPHPWLAEKIEQPDDVTYIFQIRRGVKFHDGTEMDAEAVKFSMDRVREYKPGPGYKNGQEVAETVAVDKYTFRMVLKDVNTSFPQYLTARLGGVVSPAAVKTMGEDKFNLSPVGTGPFKFVEWRNDAHVRAEKFADYWGKGADGQPLPYLDRVEWRIISEPTARLTALQAGDVHIGAVRDQDVAIVKKDPNLQFAQQAGFNFAGMWLTINRPPFDNRALRQAVAFALDREELIRVIYEGNAEVANGPIPPPLKWAVDPSYKPYTLDLQKAKEKLAEGGRPGGFEFEYWISAGDSQAQQRAELLQAQLGKAGIRMNIQAGDFNGVVIPKMQKHESNAYQLGLSGGVDPDSWVSGAFEKGGGFNFSPYENPRVDELIKAGRRTSNLEERAKIYKEAVRLIVEDVPYIFTHHAAERFTGSKKLQGWYLGYKLTTGYSEFWLNE